MNTDFHIVEISAAELRNGDRVRHEDGDKSRAVNGLRRAGPLVQVNLAGLGYVIAFREDERILIERRIMRSYALGGKPC